MSRREERELLFSFIFELSFYNKESYEDQFDLFLSNNPEISDYIKKAIELFFSNQEEIDKIIEGSLNSWSLTRLGKITLSILRTSTLEILYLEIPYSISINEAVELAKKYDDKKAPPFINGVLNNICDKQGIK